MKHLPLAALAVALATPVWAEEAALLASYNTNNCCLPPEYAVSVDVTILTDGSLTLTRCTEYATEGPGCVTRRAKVGPEVLEAIRAAALASGLAEDPADEDPDPPMGGGSTSGTVVLEGVEILLLGFPKYPDTERVKPVLQAIRAAVPTDLDRFFKM
jgi:hypothetical protein